jgi:hypothetical protein
VSKWDPERAASDCGKIRSGSSLFPPVTSKLNPGCLAKGYRLFFIYLFQGILNVRKCIQNPHPPVTRQRCCWSSPRWLIGVLVPEPSLIFRISRTWGSLGEHRARTKPITFGVSHLLLDYGLTDIGRPSLRIPDHLYLRPQVVHSTQAEVLQRLGCMGVPVPFMVTQTCSSRVPLRDPPFSSESSCYRLPSVATTPQFGGCRITHKSG